MEQSLVLPIAPPDRIADSVYTRLSDAIFAGRLRPGTRLSVPALAAQLGVSRSPVREAVQRLTAERLAREEPRRGAVVASVGTAELARLYEVREVLEGLAARLAVQNQGRRLVGELRSVLAAHELAVASTALAAHTEADLRFHGLIRAASANPELIGMLDSIQARVRLAMVTTTVTAGPRRALVDHQAILAAVSAGDPDLAEQRAREHIARLRQSLLDAPGDALTGR
jgi:DNA-binding GntR family transcriptional regulator